MKRPGERAIEMASRSLMTADLAQRRLELTMGKLGLSEEDAERIVMVITDAQMTGAVIATFEDMVDVLRKISAR